MGIDLGTLGVKAVVFDLDGNEIAASPYQEYPVYYPRTLWAEHDAHTCWKATVESIKACLKIAEQRGLSRKDILGVGVCGFGGSPTPVSRDGKFLRKTILYQDQRSIPQCKEIEEKVGQETLVRINANRIAAHTFAGPKILWIKENEPRVWKRTYKFLPSNAFINYKLTGAFAIDWSEASIWTFYDTVREEWSEELCEELDVPIEKLPECYPSTHVIGEVSAGAARETNLVKGTPVVCGGLDFTCTAFGAGMIEKGRTCDNTGSTTNFAVVIDKPAFDPRLINCHSVQPKLWHATAAMFTTGAIVRWFKDNFAEMEAKVSERLKVSPYSFLDKYAARIGPGANGHILLPYFMGERSPLFDPNARGIIFGLHLGSTKAHIFRAIMEATAYGMRHNLEIFRELGYHIEEVRAISGGAKSELWLQIKADVLNLPFVVPNILEAGDLGAALLAGIGIKAIRGFEVIDDVLKIVARYEPRPEFHEEYTKFYNIYRELYKDLKREFGLLSDIIMQPL